MNLSYRIGNTLCSWMTSAEAPLARLPVLRRIAAVAESKGYCLTEASFEDNFYANYPDLDTMEQRLPNDFQRAEDALDGHWIKYNYDTVLLQVRLNDDPEKEMNIVYYRGMLKIIGCDEADEKAFEQAVRGE